MKGDVDKGNSYSRRTVPDHLLGILWPLFNSYLFVLFTLPNILASMVHLLAEVQEGCLEVLGL